MNAAAPSPMASAARERSRLRPLIPDRPLLHAEAACLPLRSVHGQCRACEEACPVCALSVSIEAVALSNACIGCGRCTAACPTQALSLPDLLTVIGDIAEGAATRVECRRVPAAALAPGTVVAPCLGALTVSEIVARHAAGETIEVVDRGWCQACETNAWSECPAETELHPAARAVEQASLWLESIGCDTAPRLESDPLPASVQLPLTDDAPAGGGGAPRTLDRRSLFGGARRADEAPPRRAVTPMGGAGRAAYPAEARSVSPERERLLGALAILAEREGRALPADLFPRISVDASCCDKRMCTALCPTGALAAREHEGSATLSFSPERCIACGTCVRACPEGAMHLEAHGGMPGEQTLTTHRRLACVSCGETFTPITQGLATHELAQSEAVTCPTCAKARAFMQDAHRQLFGPSA